MALAGAGAFFQLGKLLIQQLVNLFIGALIKAFPAHKNNIEIGQLMLMQTQIVTSDTLDSISFNRPFYILFRNNKT